MTHELKTLPEYFEAVVDGAKPFEVRLDDRDFEVGDVLILREFGCFSSGLGTSECYSGRDVKKRVTYILRGGQFGIAPNVVVMGLGEVSK